MIIRELSQQACLEILAAARVGRLACASDGQPYVVPITIALAQHSLYSFSLPGQKIDWMRQNPKVCLQVDQAGRGDGWKSVVVTGTYEELPDRIGSKLEREHAWSLLSKHANWWEPGGLKPVTADIPAEHLFYRINMDTVTGRESVPE
ncbi:pyridoxamine 5'-phosphate oxidase family protein [Mesorhizobium sp. VNQ89]|uniref:pyridoxamine 5'-phosphate oxidase family protein n=1 Tax=Mesorhizobium quangtriensis TaxID=3157709 RepID=UPI0032B71D78